MNYNIFYQRWNNKMRIREILNEVNQSNAATMLGESWNTLPFSSKNNIYMIEKELKPMFDKIAEGLLFEKELTVDEIQQIFDDAVKRADELGNRTALGKAKDVAVLPITVMSWVDKKIGELGERIQKTPFVEGFDKQYEQLVLNVREKYQDNNRVIDAIDALSKRLKQAETDKKMWPELTVGVLTAAGAIMTGPLGGAFIMFLSKTMLGLMQGKKASSAIGSSFKQATYSFLIGKAFVALSTEILENIAFAEFEAVDAMEKAMLEAQPAELRAEILSKNPGLTQFINGEGLTEFRYTGSINRFHFDYDLIMTPEVASEYERLTKAVEIAADQTHKTTHYYYESLTNLHNYLAQVQASDQQSTLRAAINAMHQINDAGNELSYDNLVKLIDMDASIQDKFDALKNKYEIFAGLLQGATAVATQKLENMHKVGKAEKVEEEIPDNIEAKLPTTDDNVQPVNSSLEVNGDILEEGVREFFSQQVQKLKAAGKDITNIVTKNKLMTAWEKQGKPTDSKAIKKILKIFFTDDVAGGLILNYDPEVNKITDEERKAERNSQLDKLAKAIKLSVYDNELIAHIKAKLA